MKTYKILFIVSLVLLIFASTFIWYLMASGVGADTLPANKATKIQLVNSAGTAVNAQIPLDISIKAKNMNCETTNYGFTWIRKTRKLSSPSTVCKSDTAVFNNKIYTNNSGSVTISEKLLVQVDKANISKNVKDYIEQKFSAPIDDNESKTLDGIINTAVDNNKNQQQIKQLVSSFMKEYLLRNNLYQEDSKYLIAERKSTVQKVFDNDYVPKVMAIINLAVADAQKTNQFLKLSGQKIIDTVTVKVSGDLLSSETLNIAFTDADYKQNVNLAIYDNVTAEEMSKMEEFLKQYASSKKLTDEQLTAYRNVLTDYLKYTTTKSYDKYITQIDDLFASKNAPEQKLIRERYIVPVLGPIFNLLF